MFWWLIGGLLAAVVAAVVIDEIISRESIKRVTRAKEMFGKLLVEKIDSSVKTVKLSSLRDGSELEITGTGISDDIEEGDIIYV